MNLDVVSDCVSLGQPHHMMVPCPSCHTMSLYRGSRTGFRWLSKRAKLLVMLITLVLLLYMLISNPLTLIEECPNISGAPQTRHIDSPYVRYSFDKVDCSAIMAGNKGAISNSSKHAKCIPRTSIPEKQYIKFAHDCSIFKRKRGYVTDAGSEEERLFPIAFSILMFEHVEQTERLLRAIYRPQNIYCVHIDSKSPLTVHMAMHAIAGCFSNVFIASETIDVTWAWFPVLEAEVVCMKDLLRRSKTWKYFINLTGREFPLRTNLELVRILQSYRGGNDVDGTLWRRPVVWTKYHWRSENWQSWREKAPPPHGYNIAKGSTHIVVTRGFVHFAVYNNTAVDLFNWMRDIRSPDEHFFPTLNHNPQMGVPGAYTENPDFKHFLTRFKVWQAVGEVCKGTWFRFICNFGVGDLSRLAHAPELFANKFRYELNPVAFTCLEQWHANRTRLGVGNDFNLTFYSTQAWVKNHN